MARRTILLLAATIGGCAAPSGPLASGDPNGTFSYLARIGPTPVVEGTLTLVVAADSSVSGSWELHRVPGSDPTVSVGPQLGNGPLAGQLTTAGVWLDLNPGWADNNVFVALHPESAALLLGTWDHSTIIGPVTGGSVGLLRLEP
jgi:hypothetical protein